MQYEEIVALLPDFLDDKLSQRQQQWVSDSLDGSEELRSALASLKDLRAAHNQWNDEDVPQWHRTAFAVRPKARTTNWMNWVSLATSMAAIFLVMFRIQVVSNVDGYQVSFGDQINKVAFKKQADIFLNNWQTEQVSYLEHRFLEFENLQLQQNQQILKTTLQYNQDQRHKDLNQLASYFVDQRTQDITQSQQQYRQLFDSQTEDRKSIETLYASLEK